MPTHNTTEAISNWAQQVRDEHAQADRVRSGEPGADAWKKQARRFAPALREQALEDGTVKAMMKIVRPTDTVLDVGAGAGRLAIPLAEVCEKVTAVESSQAMREHLSEQATAWGVSNVDIISDRWEDAQVEPANIVVCAHVIYTTQEIEPFLRKLTEKSKREVVIVIFEEPAMSNYLPLWKLVHGEARRALPSLPELKQVLDQMGTRFRAEPLPEWNSRPFTDADSAYDEAMTRLFISVGSAQAKKLAEVLPATLITDNDELRFKWARPHRPWLVRWPGSA